MPKMCLIIQSCELHPYVKLNLLTTFQVFDGNVHPLLVKPSPIEPSVTARYVRINPLQWYQRPCLRMELYRCSLRNGMALLQLFTVKDSKL